MSIYPNLHRSTCSPALAALNPLTTIDARHMVKQLNWPGFDAATPDRITSDSKRRVLRHAMDQRNWKQEL
eukprot:11621305-Alexandrium_andersonii.AAC.1